MDNETIPEKLQYHKKWDCDCDHLWASELAKEIGFSY